MNLKKLSLLFTKAGTTFGAKITVWDEMEPEESAMVQSLNSRSAGGFWKNLLLVIKQGAGNFMEKFYSNYGHKSIADCGSTSAAFDDISMLAAKEVQNWWAYNGQETSTRFIDITGLGYIDPIGTEESKAIMERWFSFYKKALEPTIAHLKTIRPRKIDGEKPEPEDKYNTMIEKRAYDVLGSFLPAGAKTNASCHMELRQWDDKLAYMTHHPLAEISELARKTLEVLQERYPSTFIKKKVYEESEEYRKKFEKDFAYMFPHEKEINLVEKTFMGFHFQKNFFYDRIMNQTYRELLETRPIKTDVPKIINELASYRIEFFIDFRSHRDLQRQRSALQRVPLLTTKFGFEKWYLDQLPDDIRKEAIQLLDQQEKDIALLCADEKIQQYYIGMGYKVFNTFTISLADLIYVIELRTGTTVHPTARVIALKMFAELKEQLPQYVTIHADTSIDDFDINRANQDIFFEGKSLDGEVKKNT